MHDHPCNNNNNKPPLQRQAKSNPHCSQHLPLILLNLPVRYLLFVWMCKISFSSSTLHQGLRTNTVPSFFFFLTTAATISSRSWLLFDYIVVWFSCCWLIFTLLHTLFNGGPPFKPARRVSYASWQMAKEESITFSQHEQHGKLWWWRVLKEKVREKFGSIFSTFFSFHFSSLIFANPSRSLSHISYSAFVCDCHLVFCFTGERFPNFPTLGLPIFFLFYFIMFCVSLL